MLKLAFKIDKKQIHHVGTDWLSNGHWAIKREVLLVAKTSPLRRPLRSLLELPEGRYENFVRVDSPPADIEKVLPRDLDGYAQARLTSAAFYDSAVRAVRSLTLETENRITCGIAPEYAPLLELGDEVLIVDSLRPILIRKNDATVCVIMPVRQ